MRQKRWASKPEREVVAAELRLLLLAAKRRVLRYYYTGMVCDVVDRGLLAGSLAASTEMLEAMAEKGWLMPLPATSKVSPRPWVVTDAGMEEIDRRVARRVEGRRADA